MSKLKDNKELYSHLKRQLGIRFGWLSQKKLDSINTLELKNFKSIEGLESLNNLEELKLIINDHDINIDSYCDSIGKLHNLDKLDVNIPNVTYLDNDKVKEFSSNKNVKTSFNISTISWFDESYNAEEMMQIKEKLDEFKGLITPSMTQEEKVQTIYHELGNYLNFDDEQKRRGRCRNLAGAFIDRQVVCQGYSKALETILNYVGIEAITVGGQGGSLGDMGHHAWNQIKVNDKWYNADLTFDSASDKEEFNNGKWENFLKSDEEFSKSHILEDKGHICEDKSFDNKEIKICNKPTLKDKVQEKSNSAKINHIQDNKEMTQLQKHFAEVRANADNNAQQNYKPVFNVNTINHGMDK